MTLDTNVLYTFVNNYQQGMKILFKITSRSRPAKLIETIYSIISNVSKGCDYKILCSLDNDDILTMGTPLPNDGRITYFFGVSKNKIDAINRDMERAGEWDILVNVSDDQKFVEKDFDIDIRKAFDTLDQFIHFPDGNRTDLATLSIIGRKYYERDKYIYHPAYITECCDDEAQEVAKIRGCYKYVDKVIFNHLHPAYAKGLWDENYAINMQRDKQLKDRETLSIRRANGFA